MADKWSSGSKSGGGDKWSKGGGKSSKKKGGGGFFGGLKRAAGSVVTGTLDLLDKPKATVVGLVDDITDGGGFDAGRHLRNVADTTTGIMSFGMADRLPIDPIKGDYRHRGKDGKIGAPGSHIGFGDVIEEHAPGAPKWVKRAGGLAGDVLLDPTTYLTGGLSAGAKTGLKAIGKELGEEVAERVAKQGMKSLSAAERARVAQVLASAEGGSEKAAKRVLGKLDKGARGGIKFAGRTIVGGETLKPVTAPARRFGDAVKASKVGEALIPRAGVASKFGQNVADEIGAASGRARATANNATADTLDRIEKAAKAAGVTTDELRDVVLPAIDVAGDVGKLEPRLAKLANELGGIIEDTTTRQIDAEVLPGAREDYIARFLTPEAKAALGPEDTPRFGAEMSKVPGAVAKQGGHVKERTWMPDAPLADANRDLSKVLDLKGDAYEMNPLLTTAKRSALAERAVAQKQLFDDVAKIKGPDGESLLRRADDPSVRRPLGWETIDAGPLGAFHAPKEVAKEIAQVRSVIVNDDSIREFTGLLGRLNTLWKGYATVPVLHGGAGFHMRNATGNVWNNFLAGVKNPRHYARASKIQSSLAKARGDVTKLKPVEQRIVEMAKKHGVLDEGFFMHDLFDPAQQGGKLGRVAKDQRGARVKAAVNPLSTENVAIRSGRRIGSAVENNARLAHFIAKLDELGSADEAARSVKKYLFDYGDLTPFERDKLKKVAAFYTWTRKNTPLQFAEMARQPGKFTGVAHAYDASGGPQDQESLPPFLQGEPYAVSRVFGQDMALMADLPMFSALRTTNPGGADETATGMFSGFLPGLVKLAMEENSDQDLFSGKKIDGGEHWLNAGEELFPLVGKFRRSPVKRFLTKDPQAVATGIRDATGVKTFRMDAPKKSGSRSAGGSKWSK